MGFAEGLQKRCDAAKEKAELVVRKTALELHTSLIDKSPVDTGRFRGNWMTATGAPQLATTASTAVPSGAEILQWNILQTLYITNSLPYAKRLEDGWSKQAPFGMVSLTVQAFSDAFDKAIKEVR